MIKKLFYKLIRRLGIRFCNGCGKCIWLSKKTLRWADGVDYDEDNSPYLCGYTASACDDCISYAEKNIF